MLSETAGVLGLVGLELERVYFDFENQELSWEGPHAATGNDL